MINFNVTVNNGSMQIGNIQSRLNGFKPVMKLFAKYMEGSVIETFAAEGRPDKWTKSKKKSGKTLTVDAKLQKVDSAFGDDYIVVGSNKKYAAIHQFGGIIKPDKANHLAIPISDMAIRSKLNARAFMDKFNKFNYFVKKSKTSGALIIFGVIKKRKKRELVAHYVLKKSVIIPKRSYLPKNELLPKDLNYLQNKFLEHFSGGVR